MKIFIYLIMQLLILMPLTGLAADGGITITQRHQNIEVAKAQKARVKNTYGKLPLYFIENRGQVDGVVKFYERGAGHATFFTQDGVVLGLSRRASKTDKPSFNEDILGLKGKNEKKHTYEAVSLSFVGANKKAKITANDKKTGHVNYFVGNDKSKWHSNIPTYGAVTYHDIYKNIDVKFYGNNKNMEHDVIVRPGGDPSLVKFAYEGVKGFKVTEAGDLEVSLKEGKIIEKRPVIYQEIDGERVAVEGSYRILNGNTYGFTVASYDRTKNLVIDPVLVYSTYLGGSGDDFGWGIAVDDLGAAYVTGQTFSTDFPIVNPIPGAYSRSLDVFVTKINSTGTAFVYSTYLGGLSEERGFGIAVDTQGNAYVTGWTWSFDFPLMSPVQGRHGGGFADAFITKLNPFGSTLVYSTYLGGTDDDYGRDIAVDSSGAAYVTGYTRSLDFPLMDPIYGFMGGAQDAFITKINPAGTALIYSSYLGGSYYEYGNAIALDNLDSAYVTGYTGSLDFPLMNPIQATNAGGSDDAFVTKINPVGTALVYSTYLGGGLYDEGYGIAVDDTGAAYVTGLTYSTDFPTMNPIQATRSGTGYTNDAFISKIDPSGTALVYSTYLGGINGDGGYSITLDNSDFAYVTGYTGGLYFPLINPIQATFGGGWDAFVTKINPAGAAIVYSTFLGGLGFDYGIGIAVDSVGAVYLTGETHSTDFPLMSPIQATFGGGLDDAFITKISGAAPPVVTLAITPDAVSIARSSTLGYTVTATNTTATQQCFDYWENVTLPNGSTYPITGALFGPVNVCLNAGASKSAHLTHGIPMSAPVGAYIFNAYVGTNPTPVTSEAHFNFDVTAFNPATQNPQTSWRLLENGFRK